MWVVKKKKKEKSIKRRKIKNYQKVVKFYNLQSSLIIVIIIDANKSINKMNY